ncbi:MAG: hypothetical protein M1521_06620 [Thermotogae bacterium]|nr:hypothetical protein [Thermotogota bacterium]
MKALKSTTFAILPNSTLNLSKFKKMPIVKGDKKAFVPLTIPSNSENRQAYQIKDPKLWQQILQAKAERSRPYRYYCKV